MSALARRIEPVPSVRTTVESNDLADLARIYEHEVNLCVIHRQPEHALRAFVSELLRGSREIEQAETVDFEHYDFSALLPDWKEARGHAAWWRDVARLAGAFCDLFGTERVGLRLRTLDRPMCPRFHVDHVPARLVCTYGGIGTQWLPEEAVDRTKLGAGAKGRSDEESGLILDEGAIRTLPAYAIGLLKGSRWEGNEDHGIVHRSPPAAPENPRRLLLTLDLL
jgi:hypothetical protein